jgi:hypothetical protein
MSSIVVSGDTSGAITVAAPTTAGTSTLTLPSGASGTIAAQGVSTNIVSGTAVASTSGTSIDFTGIPSWVKRITVMLSGVSLSGTSSVLIQLGDSGGIENTGYVSSSVIARDGTTSTGLSSTSGMILTFAVAANTVSGIVQINLISSNSWVSAHSAGISGSIWAAVGGGTKTLSDTLTQVRITTVNGTDTFDAGSINILYE